MKMSAEEITIDVGFASSKQSLHEMFAAVLGFPGYYGMNWDAFRDCVLDPEQSSMPHHLIIEGWPRLQERLPRDAERLRGILVECDEKRADVKVTLA